MCVCVSMRAEWEVQGSLLDVYRCVRACRYVCLVGGSGLLVPYWMSTGVCMCACVQVCVPSGRFRVPYWMSTGACVCAGMCAEWGVQGSVLVVYRCVRASEYVC